MTNTSDATGTGATGVGAIDAATRGNDKRMPFGEHLEELRACLIRALVGWFLCTVVSLVFARSVLESIIAPVQVVLAARGESPELLSLSPPDLFLLYVKTGFLSGLILATPWILHQIWIFVSSGLYAHERRVVKMFLPASVGLFAAGVLFMFFIVLPIVLNFLIGFAIGFEQADLTPNAFQRAVLGLEDGPELPEPGVMEYHLPVLSEDVDDPEVGAIWADARDHSVRVAFPGGVRKILTGKVGGGAVRTLYSVQFFVSFVLALALGFGLAFELPIVVIAVAATGVVSVSTMVMARRHVLLIIVVFSAVLTPPDVVSQVLLAIPMYGLFEAGLIVARRFEPKRG